MPYPSIISRRIPYDIDGTAVGMRYWRESSESIQNGVKTWLSQNSVKNLNSESNDEVFGTTAANHPRVVIWIFFPEMREVENIMLSWGAGNNVSIVGSVDTTNGVDGTWETPVFSQPPKRTDNENRRVNIFPVSFSSPIKVLRFYTYGGTRDPAYFYNIHIYGRKAFGETVDDILLCDVNGNELTALMDWGDRPEGTTIIKSFKVKNASTTKIANNVNLQLNHADFLMSLDQVSWVATIDIASIPANSLSAEIFIKNTLGPPLLILGPKVARIIATVGSWT